MKTAAPLFITQEGFQQLVENIVSGANEKPWLGVLDALLELKECDWCHRRIGEEDLKNKLCPGCRVATRARLVLAEHLCTMCKGDN